jgi:lipoprotein-anchoring transpeptidase ErfK/SrfK
MATSASAQVMNYAATSSDGFAQDSVMASPDVDENDASVVPERLRRQMVAFDTREAPGTVVIDTANTQLYFVLGQGRAVRYGVGVGREGFTWSGTQTVTRKAEWPDWHPPAAMIARQPYLPRFMAGGPGNPLGARAMYLGSSDYRIHGTNDPSTIGKFVSSGCIRLTNDDVADLFSRVQVGSKVVVLPKSGAPRFEASAAAPRSVTNIHIKPAQAAATGRQAMNVSAPSPY